MDIVYNYLRPTIKEVNNLREKVNWGRIEESIIERSFDNTILFICGYCNNELIGMARILGDRSMYLYIHDVMVDPKYQRNKIGTSIMGKLLENIEEFKNINPDIRVYLGATKGKEHFYEKFGFIVRPNEDLGAGMILKE